MTSDEQRYWQLAQKLSPGSLVEEIRPLVGGMSAQMTAFELIGVHGQQKYIRRSYAAKLSDPPSSPVAHEFRLLQTMQAVGLATPMPYYLDLSGEIFAEPYLVIEYVEGQMLFTPSDLADYLCQLASHLAQIHSADYAKYDLSFLPKRGHDCSELGKERPSPPHPTLHETKIRQALTTHTPNQHNPSTLLHGDYWPGNSLWRDSKLVAVIDWEDATWGDPLIDLAISRLDLVWIFGIEAMHSFTRQYLTLNPVNITNLPYWDLCAALRFIRIFGDNLAEAGAYFIPFGREDIDAQTIEANFDYFVTQALKELE